MCDRLDADPRSVIQTNGISGHNFNLVLTNYFNVFGFWNPVFKLGKNGAIHAWHHRCLYISGSYPQKERRKIWKSWTPNKTEYIQPKRIRAGAKAQPILLNVCCTTAVGCMHTAINPNRFIVYLSAFSSFYQQNRYTAFGIRIYFATEFSSMCACMFFQSSDCCSSNGHYNT